MKEKTLFITRTAMFTALACALTIFPKIPIGQGYVHLGDCVIYAAAIVLGPAGGAIVGAVGHSLADLISGFPVYCLPTLIIKGVMGFTIGMIFRNNINVKSFVLAAIAAFVIVTVGYFMAEWPLLGRAQAMVSLISSPIQWGMSIAASAVVLPVIIKNRERLKF